MVATSVRVADVWCMVGLGEGIGGWLVPGSGLNRGVCKMPRTSNVRVDLRLRGTSKLTELEVRYCANERSIAFVGDDARVTNHGGNYSER
jgi:hypothetical protein